MIISTTKLDEILNDSNLVLIDTRSYKEYSADHILGAVNLDLFTFHWFDTSKKGIENFNSQTSELFSLDRKSTRLNSSHSQQSRMPSSA